MIPQKIFTRYTVRVIAITPYGIPLVADSQIPKKDRYWKFPGGGSKPEDNDNPLLTAQRELEEETGMLLDLSRSRVVLENTKKNGHRVYVVVGNPKEEKNPLSNLPRINSDRELVSLFSREEVRNLIADGEFLFPHVALLWEAPKLLQDFFLS